MKHIYFHVTWGLHKRFWDATKKSKVDFYFSKIVNEVAADEWVETTFCIKLIQWQNGHLFFPFSEWQKMLIMLLLIGSGIFGHGSKY